MYTSDEEGPIPDTLCGVPLVLRAPALHAERWDPLFAQREGKPGHRVLMGALGLCNERIRRRIPYDGDVVAYGGRVLEALLSTEHPDHISVIMRCGRAAFRLCNETAVTGEDLDAARGFSEAPAESSSGNNS